MKKYLICLPVILFLACTNTTGKEYAKNKLIRDNLYADSEGNLYLKSRTREHFETGKWIDVWIKTVYCDTCWTPTENGMKNITELKDFVDINTWQYDKSNENWTEYIDKNYRYHHTHMADGGTISLEPK